MIHQPLDPGQHLLQVFIAANRRVAQLSDNLRLFRQVRLESGNPLHHFRLQRIHKRGHGTVLRFFKLALQALLDLAEAYVHSRLDQDRKLNIEFAKPLVHLANLDAQLFDIGELRGKPRFECRERSFGEGRRRRCGSHGGNALGGFHFHDPALDILQAGEQGIEIGARFGAALSGALRQPHAGAQSQATTEADSKSFENGFHHRARVRGWQRNTRAFNYYTPNSGP